MIDERRLEEALHARRAREWPGPSRNQRIEEFIMQQSERRMRPSRLALWLGAIALVGGGVAIGGAQIYRMYTVRVESGGQWVEQQMPADASGKGQTVIQLKEGTAHIVRNADGTVQVELVPDPEGAKSGETTATVTTTEAATAGATATPAAPK